MAERELGFALLAIARSSIGAQFGLGSIADASHPALGKPGATFVTLRLQGELRGCIGSVEPRRALGDDVRENAIASAFRDPRFAPLTRMEFGRTSIEVSLLSPAERIDVRDEEDLLAQVRPGVDGLVIAFGGHRATFLPQVWEMFTEPREFLVALKRKAGLPPEFWSTDMSVWRYGVTKWTDSEFLMSGAMR
jgi:AmmeMemoRadiSam system protein A